MIEASISSPRELFEVNAPSPPQLGETIHYVPLRNLPAVDLFHSEDESTILALNKLLPENRIDPRPGAHV